MLSRMMLSFRSWVLPCFWFFSAIASQAEPLPRLEDLIGEFSADLESVRTAFRLPWSESEAERQRVLLAQWRQRIDTLPFESLTHDDQIDWLLLHNHLAQWQSAMDGQTKRLAEMDPLLPFRKAIQNLALRRQNHLPVQPEQAATELATLVEPLKEMQRKLEEQRGEEKKEPKANDSVPPSAPGRSVPLVTDSLALRTAQATDAIRSSLTEWFEHYDGYHPEFGWWVRSPYAKATQALKDYAKLLREDFAGQNGKPEDPLVGDPIGARDLATEIAEEYLPYSAEELIAIGETEFAWCESQMREAATKLGTDPAGALAKIKAAHVPPGEQGNLVVSEAERAIGFLKRNDLVTIPPLCEESWRVQMISPDGQKQLPYAVYSDPAIMVAYAAETMPHEDKLMSMKGNNRHFTRIVTAHELIPGHHLQRFAAARQRPWRSLFSTPFFVEGWALHWEMLLWDRGFAESPEDQVGMLFWRMHRCARIIVSLKFHLGQMTPAQMVDFLVQRVGHEKMGATSEVRRYISGSYGPLYQAAYLLGGMQLRSLHRELTQTSKLSNRAFHDAVLAENAMPIEILRAAITKSPLSRDWKSAWRFAQ